jgi:hypothetical protein
VGETESAPKTQNPALHSRGPSRSRTGGLRAATKPGGATRGFHSKTRNNHDQAGADIFVSRLDPDTTGADIKKHIQKLLNINFALIECRQLQTKHSGYASFHVCIPARWRSRLLQDSAWPEGVYVRQYFLKH